MASMPYFSMYSSGSLAPLNLMTLVSMPLFIKISPFFTVASNPALSLSSIKTTGTFNLFKISICSLDKATPISATTFLNPLALIFMASILPSTTITHLFSLIKFLAL